MKRFIAILIAATFLCLINTACSLGQDKSAPTQTPTETAEEETVAEFHTTLNWEIVSTQPYYRDNKECIAWRVYVSDSEYSITNYDIRDLYMELLQTHDPTDEYYSHIVWIFFDRTSADGTGIADISIEQIVSSRHDAEVNFSGNRFIITNSGAVSPSVPKN